MGRKIIENPDCYSLQPKDIDTTRYFYGAFGHFQTEVSAKEIVRYLQEKGEGWKPFTYGEIDEFSSAPHRNDFQFYRLIEYGWIVKKGKLFYVTEEFVERCFESSPAITVETVVIDGRNTAIKIGRARTITGNRLSYYIAEQLKMLINEVCK